MQIILIGPYPPPYGGISVHIKRMKNFLKKNNIDVIIYNESKNSIQESNVIQIVSYKKFIFRIPFIKGDIVHFHCCNVKVRMFLSIYKFLGKKVILTIHGESLHEQIDKGAFLNKYILINSLKKIDKIICVNPKTVSELLNLGFSEKKLISLPAYCNPIEDEKDSKNIPECAWKFMNKDGFLISANGAIRFNNKQDLYGLDMLIELIYRLKCKKYKVQLIFALLAKEEQNIDESNYYSELKNKINSLNLNEYIFIYEVKHTEFYPILKNSNLFLRPTNTDGDAISIREALYYKIPAIASDVVPRPEGTVLFKTRDIDDLYTKTVEVINNYNLHKEKIKNINIEDNAEKILKVYKQLLKL